MSSRIEESGSSGGKEKERRDGDQSALSRRKEKSRENQGERSRHSRGERCLRLGDGQCKWIESDWLQKEGRSSE